MKGWVKKEAVIAASKKHKDVFLSWLSDCNVWVPCTIQMVGSKGSSVWGELKPDYAWIKIYPLVFNQRKAKPVQVPIDSVKIENKFLKHWLPLQLWPEFEAFMGKVKNWDREND